MKRKIKVLITLMLVFTLVLSACGQSSNETGEETGGETGSSTGEEKTLVIALEPDYFTFDPGYSYEFYAPMVLGATYENLYEIKPDSETPVPQLATGVEISEDNLTYTFTINPDAVFASGNKVTAEDVRFSLERAKNLQSNATALLVDEDGNGIVSVEAPEEDTVVITLSKPDSSFIAKTTSTSYCILDSEIIKEQGGVSDESAPTNDTAQKFLNDNSAGSGPYIMESFTPDDKIILVRNESYWKEEPYYEKIIIQDMPDANSQLIAVQQGDVDIAFNLGADQINNLDSDNVNVISSTTMTMGFIYTHMDPEIGKEVSDPNVQKAIRYAIDYEGMQSIIGEGTITPVSFIQDGFLGALEPKDPSTARDLEKAKEFLANSPYPDGFEIDFPVCDLAPEGVPLSLIAEKLKSDLEEIGININIIPQEWGGGYGDDYRNGDIGFTAMYWGPDYYDPNNQLAFLPGQFVGHRAGWTADMNPELAAMHEEVLLEIDNDKRAELYEEIQELTAEDSPFIVHAQYPKFIAASKDVENVEYSNVYRMDLYELR